MNKAIVLAAFVTFAQAKKFLRKHAERDNDAGGTRVT